MSARLSRACSTRRLAWRKRTALFAVALNVALVLAFSISSDATTLEELSLPSMTRQSTGIVRARVTGSRNLVRGSDAFTEYQLEILEIWKSSLSSGRAPSHVAVPGGVVNGSRQVVSGAPVLQPGREYVLFLWTSPRGLTQIIGLSQGLFTLQGSATAIRAAAQERMVNSAGEPVASGEMRIPLPDLKAQVVRALEAAR